MAPGAQQTTDSGDASRAYSLAAIPPQPFDKYTLIGKLGHGGMAEVNLAVSEGKGNFRKLVVIKRLHRHLAMEPGFIDMFLDEARLAARLDHPHCVQTYEVGEWQDNHFLAMEYLDGQGLERLLRISGQKRETIPVDHAARIVADALEGLSYAHELTDYDGTPLHVVHRDVSPQNIFITYNGVVKLLDFGIAKAATHVVETRTGVIKGKYAYIAPEQALAQELDHRADIWSMGVVLWEVLTGRRLFKSVNELATLQETLQGDIKPPSVHRSDIPKEIDRICMRALTRDPTERYQSAHEMKDDLEAWLAAQPKPAGRKQIARLMRERFAEVIEVQKQTLAQCLKGSAVIVSGVHQLMDPMVTPSGMSPTPGARPSMTPTPTPSGASGPYVAVTSGPYAAVTPSTAQQVTTAKKGLGWKLSLLMIVVAAAGAAAIIIPNRRDQAEVVRAAGASEATSAETQPAPPPEPAVSEAPPTKQALPEPHAQGEQPAQAEPQVQPTPAPEPRAQEREVDRSSRHRHTERRAAQEAQHEAPAPEHTPPPATAPGYLTLATTPWAHVSLDGRDLGTTPLIRVELPPGAHTLTLTNPEQGIEETYRVTITSGETVTRRLGLR